MRRATQTISALGPPGQVDSAMWANPCPRRLRGRYGHQMGGSDEHRADSAYYAALLRPLVEERRVIVAGVVLGGSSIVVDTLRSLGAADVFVLAQARGTGPVPEDTAYFDLDITARTIDQALRATIAAVKDPPAAAIAAIDEFDPDRSAIVVGDMFNEAAHIAGRRSLSYRRPEWIALEDKVVIDACWERWGVTRAPSVVVQTDLSPLVKAASEIDEGNGTVWAGDAREGFNGGAEYARWVRNPTDAEAAALFLGAHCDRARVMPFLEGIPCSIHGVVFDDYVAALRPYEMVTLRHAEGPELFYAGVGSYWDPPPADREEMRRIARRVGAALRADVDYRGGFTIDGVMTAEGFRPTELNPRPGAALGTLSRALPELPLPLLFPAISGGVELDYRPTDLEELLLSGADRVRAGGTWSVLPTPLSAVQSRAMAYDGSEWRTAESGERTQSSLAVGHASAGSFVRLTLGPDWPVGQSIAPAAAAFWRFVTRTLDPSLPAVLPAHDVRRTT